MAVKNLDNVKYSILAFIKRIVSKRIYNAISVVLNPCCTIAITDAEYDCDEEVFTLTISPARPSFAGFGGFAEIFTNAGTVGNKRFLGDGIISANGETITLEIEIADMVFGTDQIFTANIFLPTGVENETIGVFQTAVSPEITIASC